MAQEVLARLGSNDSELSLLLVDNKSIRELNKKYLGKNSPTDVLSFPMNEGAFGNVNPNILGDVVLSLEKAKELAAREDTPLQTIIANLLIHGILHLHGYDHERSLEDERKMNEEAKKLFGFVKDKGLV
ncbi:MAG: rRNA maturation RNase YbeY [Thermodesulfobacteriota bacterium]